MKLTPYTPEQTQELIEYFYKIAQNQIDLNRFSIDCIKRIYDEYLSTFKMKWYRWSAVDFETFVDKLDIWNSNTEIFTRFIDGAGAEVYKCTSLERICGLGAISENHLKAHSPVRFTELEKEIITFTNNFNRTFSPCSNFIDRYKICTKYAKTPFEIEESDIMWISNIEYWWNNSNEKMEKIRDLQSK